MQVGDIVLRRGTAFDEVHFRAFFHDDQRVLELAGPGGIQTEITLQRDFYVHAGGNIHEGAAGPYGTVEGRKFVICRRNEFHEVLPYYIFMLFQGRVKVRIDDALLDQFFLNAVVHDFRIVLRADASKGCLLRFGDAETIERILNVFGHFAPIGFQARIGTYIRNNIIHLKFADIGPPVGIIDGIEQLQGLQAFFEHPGRFILLPGNFPDDVFRKARFRLISIVEIFFKVIYIAEIGKGINRFPFPGQSCFFSHPAPPIATASCRCHIRGLRFHR